MTQNHYNAYTTANHMVRKTKQVVMLYDGAIRYVQQAKEAIEKNDIEARFNALVKACDIINGLQISLDFDKGGDVAKLLYDYYAGIDMRLMSVHQSQDTSICDLCIKHLKMMREAWDEIDQKYEADGTPIDEDKALYDPALSKSLQENAGLSVTV